MHVARRRNPEATQTSTGLKTETIAACLEHGLCPFYNGKHGNCCVASRCHLKHQILYSTPASGDERIRQPRDDYNAVLDRKVQRTQEAMAKAQEDAAAEERRQEQLEQERKDRESTRAYRSTYKLAAGDTMYDLRFNAVAPRSFGKLDLDTGPSDAVEEENIRSHEILSKHAKQYSPNVSKMNDIYKCQMCSAPLYQEGGLPCYCKICITTKYCSEWCRDEDSRNGTHTLYCLPHPGWEMPNDEGFLTKRKYDDQRQQAVAKMKATMQIKFDRFRASQEKGRAEESAEYKAEVAKLNEKYQLALKRMAEVDENSEFFTSQINIVEQKMFLHSEQQKKLRQRVAAMHGQLKGTKEKMRDFFDGLGESPESFHIDMPAPPTVNGLIGDDYQKVQAAYAREQRGEEEGDAEPPDEAAPQAAEAPAAEAPAEFPTVTTPGSGSAEDRDSQEELSSSQSQERDGGRFNES